jgi:hypothetical protein
MPNLRDPTLHYFTCLRTPYALAVVEAKAASFYAESDGAYALQTNYGATSFFFWE